MKIAILHCGSHFEIYFLLRVEQSDDVDVGTRISKQARKMVRRCIVGGCSNTTRDGISLHKFPSNTLRRRQWILEVKKTRADWKEPSAFSEVCSDHFSKDCFESIADKLGLRMKRILKPNAIPTIFKSRPYNKTKSRMSKALQKTRTVSDPHQLRIIVLSCLTGIVYY